MYFIVNYNLNSTDPKQSVVVFGGFFVPTGTEGV